MYNDVAAITKLRCINPCFLCMVYDIQVTLEYYHQLLNLCLHRRGPFTFLSSFCSCVHSAQFCEDVCPSTWRKPKTTWIGKEKSRKGGIDWEAQDCFSQKTVWKLGKDTPQKWEHPMIKRLHTIFCQSNQNLFSYRWHHCKAELKGEN